MVAAAENRTVGELRAALERAVLANDDAKKPLWEAYRGEMLRQRALARFDEGSNPVKRAQLIALCRKSPLFFARTFGKVVEPRKTHRQADTGAITEFVPFPHQEWCAQHMLDVLKAADNPTRLTRADVPQVMWPKESAEWGALDDHRSIIFPKTRDMGLTWTALHLIVWHWLFEPGFSCILGSRNEEEVDRVAGAANEQTLLGRVEIILRALPGWLLPPGYDLTDVKQRQIRYFRNPENGNLLHGQPSSPHFGHGNRSALALLDEFDRWPDAESVFDGTQDTVDARWLLTTPFEKGMQMAKRVVDNGWARSVEVSYELHPTKDSAWLEEQRRTRSTAGFASQIMISWEGDSSLTIYGPEWERVDKGRFPFVPGWPVYGSIDFGRADGTGIIWAQRNPATGRLRLLASYYAAGYTIDYYFPFFGKQIGTGIFVYGDAELLLIKRVQQWARAGIIWYGDPAGDQLTQTANLSVIGQMAQQGIVVQTNTRIRSHDMRQDATRFLLRNCEVDAEGCATLHESMLNYRKPKSRGGIRPQKQAVHNWASHLATALEYLAVNIPPLTQQAAPDVKRHRAAWEAS